MARRFKSGVLTRKLEAWVKAVRQTSREAAIAQLANFNAWDEAHWKQHQQRLLDAIAGDSLAVVEQRLGRQLGRVHVTLGGHPDGICFFRDGKSWRLLASVFDWTSMDFNGMTAAQEAEIQQLNLELLAWQLEVLAVGDSRT